MKESALFSEKTYTADKNFARPLVVAVMTNINSGEGEEYGEIYVF